MPDTSRSPTALDRIVAEAERLAPDGQVSEVAAFVRGYFARAADEEMLELEPQVLAGIALGHRRFAAQRAVGEALVRVYNPEPHQHGWAGRHTVLEIVVEDSPFLIDSVTMALNRHALNVHRLFHPVLGLRRDEAGALLGVNATALAGNEARTTRHAGADRVRLRAESLMHFEIDQCDDPELMRALADEVRRVLATVRSIVEDWPQMCETMVRVADGDELSRSTIDASQAAEVREFLRWLADDHFTLLGYRRYELETRDGELMLCTVRGSGLGILRQDDAQPGCRSLSALPAEQRAFALGPLPLLVNKTVTISTVHREGRMDYVGVKRFGQDGQVIGEHRFLGLLSSSAYNARPSDIPLLRSKRAQILKQAGFDADSHDARALAHVVDSYPRDELFQADVEELYRTCAGILQMRERRSLRLFTRRDPFGRFVSCLVFIPRDRYNTDNRLRIQEALCSAFGGYDSEFSTRFSASTLARVRITVFTDPSDARQVTLDKLEAQLRELLLNWDERLERALVQAHGHDQGHALALRYRGAFGPQYQADFEEPVAVADIGWLEQLDDDNPARLDLYRPPRADDTVLRLKVYRNQGSVPLSDAVPLLENMGLRVLAARPYEVRRDDGTQSAILEFQLERTAGIQTDPSTLRGIFEQAVLSVWFGRADNDGFNKLVLAVGLEWREVVVLRAYCKYLLQIGMPFSQAYVESVLLDHAQIAGMLVELFMVRFDPAHREHGGREFVQRKALVEEALDSVASLDADRILRLYLAMVESTTRTNFFRKDEPGGSRDYLAFKLDPGLIPRMPAPRPMFEIFVYSPRVEGVHLRGGHVARGGIRWSDRMEDYRTEVLGLMKAQMVKNSVIVPVGSKGGFVVKRMPAEGEQAQQEVVDCYRTLIRGMLDLTDNRVAGVVIAPPDTVRHDGEDPYLVVAADKGTARFSDIANAISTDYGFWLGDAFASGGSAGYDHKAMGITARGAWESVKHHFRELGRDIQREPFTAVGIGDMSGDVFGNGMLLSPQTRLVAAFDHRHIFLDPSPDPATSLAERRRLFELPRSSWADYDPALISAGGAVFARTRKSIPLSEEVRAMLDVQATELSPPELVRAILKAPVDLLWNGGIGTYVKASDESDAQVGDRANDAVRVNAASLRVRVIGEGGNLGLTQRARIEAAQGGVSLFTDAVDNSAGVNCSDHEVNIKILLEQATAAAEMSREQRDQILSEMTDEVANLVLAENRRQPQAIALELANASAALDVHVALMRELERAGRLDRALEFLPDDEAIARRAAAGGGLTAPELAVLLAYAKIVLFDALVQSDVPDDPHFDAQLQAYFPERLRSSQAAHMKSHPLRRQIISTCVANEMLDHMGPAFVQRMQHDCGKPVTMIVRAYAAARQIFDADACWQVLESLEAQGAAAIRLSLMGRLARLLERGCLWLLRNVDDPMPVDAMSARFRGGVDVLAADLRTLLAPGELASLQQERTELEAQGLPAELAESFSGLEWRYHGLEIARIARRAGVDDRQVARTYFGISGLLELDWLRAAIRALPVQDDWHYRAQASLLERLERQSRGLVFSALEAAASGATGGLPDWSRQRQVRLDTIGQTLSELKLAPTIDLAMLSVLLDEIETLLN